MSDPLSVGLAIAGLLPVVVEVFTGFKKTRSALKLAKHCAKDLNAIVLDVQVQQVRFLHSLESLLRAVQKDDQLVRDMVHDGDHPLWTDAELNAKVQKYLDRDYNLCMELVRELVVVLEEVYSSLGKFELLRQERQKGESFKKTLKRLHKTVQFDKKSLDTNLERVRRLNEGVETIGRRTNRLSEHKDTSKSLATREIPTHIIERRSLSIDAHDSLTSNFICKYRFHTEHTAAIAITTVDEEEICLKMALFMTCANRRSKPAHEQLHFLLYPVDIEHDSYLPTPDSSPSEDSSACSATKLGKRKAQFVDNEIAKKTTVKNKTYVKVDVSGDIRCISITQVECACRFLQENSSCSGPARPLAYLEPSIRSSRRFYLSNDANSEKKKKSYAHLSQTIREFITCQPESTITELHQYRLALGLSLSVLQCHSTAWLPETLELSNIIIQAEVNGIAENTPLFLKSRIANKLPDGTPATPPNETEIDMQSPDTNNHLNPHTWIDDRGIYNKLLFCLGVILLEIGHWAPLSSLREAHDQDEIATARRMARKRTPLGKVYQEITNKCLRCDFGFGTDLANPRLQKSFYNFVVLPLRERVEEFERLGI